MLVIVYIIAEHDIILESFDAGFTSGFGAYPSVHRRKACALMVAEFVVTYAEHTIALSWSDELCLLNI